MIYSVNYLPAQFAPQIRDIDFEHVVFSEFGKDPFGWLLIEMVVEHVMTEGGGVYEFIVAVGAEESVAPPAEGPCRGVFYYGHGVSPHHGFGDSLLGFLG